MILLCFISSGEVVNEKFLWIGNDNTPASNKPRQRVALIIPDVPTRYNSLWVYSITQLNGAKKHLS